MGDQLIFWYRQSTVQCLYYSGWVLAVCFACLSGCVGWGFVSGLVVVVSVLTGVTQFGSLRVLMVARLRVWPVS